MEIINGTSLSNMCDYSFGDHLSAIDPVNLIGAHMRPAHPSNAEFLVKAEQFKGKVMTLFIDNIRLYNRPLEVLEQDAGWVTYLLKYNDLLALCQTLPENKFIIFTSHEDTPIDEHIKIPENVLAIHAVNAEHFGGKIHPFPYGLQRPIGEDHRIEIMKKEVEEDKTYIPSKLLYINCGLGKERNAPERAFLPSFEGKSWATCRFDKNSKFFPYDKYIDFLGEIRDHKFMICPRGHGLDCHRNWESLYLRRVPVMKDHPYFRRLMEGFPVLFVKDWDEVTEELLKKNDHLFDEAAKMDLSTLDLNRIFYERTH